jgi:hypothetical protein
LARGSYAYILDKFSYTNKADLEKVFDAKRTQAELRAHLIKMRRDGSCSREVARGLWGDLDYVSHAGTAEEFVMEAPVRISRMWPSVWEWAATKPSPRWRFMHDELLPFFCGVLREELGTNMPCAKQEGK